MALLLPWGSACEISLGTCPALFPVHQDCSPNSLAKSAGHLSRIRVAIKAPNPGQGGQWQECPVDSNSPERECLKVTSVVSMAGAGNPELWQKQLEMVLPGGSMAPYS